LSASVLKRLNMPLPWYLSQKVLVRYMAHYKSICTQDFFVMELTDRTLIQYFEGLWTLRLCRRITSASQCLRSQTILSLPHLET
jgi:hypothetical protein